MPLSGAPMAGADIAIIPHTAKTHGGAPENDSHKIPNKSPAAAPIKRVGLKTPPGAPKPKQSAVAAVLQIANPANDKSQKEDCEGDNNAAAAAGVSAPPVNARKKTWPPPMTAGAKSAMSPTKKPAKTGRANGGTAAAALCSAKIERRKNPPYTPSKTPNANASVISAKPLAGIAPAGKKGGRANASETPCPATAAMITSASRRGE